MEVKEVDLIVNCDRLVCKDTIFVFRQLLVAHCLLKYLMQLLTDNFGCYAFELINKYEKVKALCRDEFF